MSDHEKTLEFLALQTHMTISVVLPNGSPWATPVKLQKWDGYDFEWDSLMSTEHSKALEQNPRAAVTMYSRDSDSFGQFGVYLLGKVACVSSNEKGTGRYRFTATEVWINDASFRKRQVEL